MRFPWELFPAGQLGPFIAIYFTPIQMNAQWVFSFYKIKEMESLKSSTLPLELQQVPRVEIGKYWVMLQSIEIITSQKTYQFII